MSKHAKPDPAEDAYLAGFIAEGKLYKEAGPLSRGKGRRNQKARKCRHSGETIQTNRVVRRVEKP